MGQRGFFDLNRRYESLDCKFARNNDPLRGDFASNSTPPDVLCQHPSFWP